MLRTGCHSGPGPTARPLLPWSCLGQCYCPHQKEGLAPHTGPLQLSQGPREQILSNNPDEERTRHFRQREEYVHAYAPVCAHECKCVHMSAIVCICAHPCVYVCAYTNVCMSAGVCTCVCMCTCVHISLCVLCMCVYVCAYTCADRKSVV